MQERAKIIDKAKDAIANKILDVYLQLALAHHHRHHHLEVEGQVEF